MLLSPLLKRLFRNSDAESFIETSAPTNTYNCIAWALEDMTEWYWPGYKTFWPKNILREETLDAFRMLFESKGYYICDSRDSEAGYQKIAIYTNGNNVPTHAARQLPDGLWTRKLGEGQDISHTIESMSDGFYGNVAMIMKKKL